MTGLYVAYNFKSKPVEFKIYQGTGWVVLTKMGTPRSIEDIERIRRLILEDSPSYEDVIPIFWSVLPDA